jgi:hypothetical protein
MLLKNHKTLKLVLKSKWFRMIESGEKLEDYREIKPFYDSRLKNKPEYVEFQLGYSKKIAKIIFEIQGIFLYSKDNLFTITGIEPPLNEVLKARFCKSCEKEWGFEEEKCLYIIRLGKKVL